MGSGVGGGGPQIPSYSIKGRRIITRRVRRHQMDLRASITSSSRLSWTTWMVRFSCWCGGPSAPPQQDPDLLPRIDLKASPDPWFFPAESADQWLSGSYGSKPAPEPSKKSCGETLFRSPRQQGRGRAVRETGGWNSRRNNLAPTLFLLFPLWSLFPAGVKAKDVQSQQSDFGIYGYRKQRAGKGALSAKLGI